MLLNKACVNKPAVVVSVAGTCLNPLLQSFCCCFVRGNIFFARAAVRSLPAAFDPKIAVAVAAAAAAAAVAVAVVSFALPFETVLYIAG